MSNYLKNIINNKNQICDMQIVFIDIVKYSKRKTVRQVQLINAFTKLIKDAIIETNKEHLESFQSNKINLQSDSIIIPTGDGLAIGMPFTWIKTLHLDTALNVLSKIYNENQLNKCEKFENNGWCDCHNNLYVRIGIAIGTVILYRDINDAYNIAGNPINMAARVMNCADNNQIMFTKEAFKLFEDLSTESNLFFEYKDREIKHGLFIDLYQYVNENISSLNSNVLNVPTDHSDEEIKSNRISDLIDLVTINSGSFKRQFDNKKVLVINQFAISKYLVTQELYETICGNNPSHFSGKNRPIENITFIQAIEFCNLLSESDGYKPVYNISNDGSVNYDKKIKGYRLPFEYELDYTLSILLTEVKSITELKPWLNHNSNNQTQPIIMDSSRTSIVVDLIGNVWEWCFDNFAINADYSSFENNIVLQESSKLRVIKGGAYTSTLTQLQKSNFRRSKNQERKSKGCGIRIILQNINL